MLYPPTLHVKLTLPVEASCGDRYADDSDHSVRKRKGESGGSRETHHAMDREGTFVKYEVSVSAGCFVQAFQNVDYLLEQAGFAEKEINRWRR